MTFKRNNERMQHKKKIIDKEYGIYQKYIDFLFIKSKI